MNRFSGYLTLTVSYNMGDSKADALTASLKKKDRLV